MHWEPLSPKDIKCRFVEDVTFRDRVLMTISTCLNFLYACTKLTIGIYKQSFWFMAIAIYYLCLWSVRSLILWAFEQKQMNIRREYRLASLCGYWLLLLNAALSGVTLQVVRDGLSYEYPGYIVILAGCYAYYCLISSFWNVLRQRRNPHPLMAVSKIYTFATALTSLMFMQTALFANFGQHFLYTKQLNMITCCVLCFMLTWMGSSIILRASHYCRLHPIENKISEGKEREHG